MMRASTRTYRSDDIRCAASCLIFDFWSYRWSSTPASMDMINARCEYTAAGLDGKIVVAGERDRDGNALASIECIDADALLEYAPLHYPIHCQCCSSIEFSRFANLKWSLFLVQS